MKTRLQTRLVFTGSQRAGIAVLASLIIALQLACLFSDFSPERKTDPDAANWLALQKEIDSLKSLPRRKPAIYPFNPNFITDYKGYRLGMSVAEIDRLFAFREKGNFVNSASEFQQVTKISDSLLGAISPYFKFPDWVRNRKSHGYAAHKKGSGNAAVIDINHATREDLMKVYGIGDALSDRILKQRDLLGAFVDMKQMSDVWGLSAEVVSKLQKGFAVLQPPAVRKIAINDASLKELAAFPYFRYALAKAIITYRSMNGKISNPDDLAKIDNFPVDNVKIISLYLEF